MSMWFDEAEQDFLILRKSLAGDDAPWDVVILQARQAARSSRNERVRSPAADHLFTLHEPDKPGISKKALLDHPSSSNWRRTLVAACTASSRV